MPKVTLPKICQPLFDSRRIKVIKGGTFSGKTQAAARALVTLAAMEKSFVVCLLESQQHVEESAMRLMMDIAEEYEMAEDFVKAKSSIVCANGSEVLFEQVSRCGRLLERADFVWVDDAHNITPKSLNNILMGARKPHSEVWFTLNPGKGNGVVNSQFEAGGIYDPLIIEVNYRDNTHFPEELEIERQRALREDPEAYRHEWEGIPVEAPSGSYTLVGDDGTVEDIAADSPMAILRGICLDKSVDVSSKIEAARAMLPYVHKKQPVAVEGLGNAAGLAGVITPERLAKLDDSDIQNMLAVLQGGGNVIDVTS